MKVRTWGGHEVTDEPEEEDPLTVYITVEVPLDVALRFEHARGVRSRNAFFTSMLDSYEQRYAQMFPQAGEPE